MLFVSAAAGPHFANLEFYELIRKSIMDAVVELELEKLQSDFPIQKRISGWL